MIPSEGQLQALYEIPVDNGEIPKPTTVANPAPVALPDPVDPPGPEPPRPAVGARGTPEAPTADEATWQAWSTRNNAYTVYQGAAASYAQYELAKAAYDAYLVADRAYVNHGSYHLRLKEWGAEIRPVCGLTEMQYRDERLAALARSARACIAMELCGLDPLEGEETTSWTSLDGTIYTVRRIPDDVIRTAVGYLVRALYFDGVAKWDEWQSAKFGRELDTQGAATMDTADSRAGYLLEGPDPDAIRQMAMGPRGSQRLIRTSGALMLIAPYVRRRIVTVW